MFGDADLQENGEALVAAAQAGDLDTVVRATSRFVRGGHIDEGIPYWERATQNAHAAFTLARYRKIRGDRAAAEQLYRSAADTDADCAYGLGVLLQEEGSAEAADWFRRGWELGRRLSCKIELGKLLAVEGALAEASGFLMADAEIGDIAVFRWVELFDDLRTTLEQVGEDLAAAGDPDEAAEAVYALNELRAGIKDYPGLLPEVEKHYRTAAELGRVSALVDHALTLDEAGPADRAPEVRSLLLQARDLGYLGAAYILGLLAEYRGELAESEVWYTEAATAGHEAAQWNLGILCQRQRRLDEAEHWFREVGPDAAPEFATQIEGLDRLRAMDHTARRRDVENLPALRARAEAGDVEAGYEYGSMLYEWGGATSRHMIPWLRPAAEAGNPQAAFDLAEHYAETGERILRDAWWRRAAELGSPGARAAMGALSLHHQDWQEAERWYEASAASGGGLAAMMAGKLKAQRGAYAEAEPLLRRVWDLGPDLAYAPENAGYYGVVLHRLGRSAEAVAPLRAAVARWREVERRYDPDDLVVRARTPDMAKVLAEAEAAVEAAEAGEAVEAAEAAG